MDEPNAPRPRPRPGPREAHPRAFQPLAGTGISRAAIAVAALVILAALGGGWYWWQQRSTFPPLQPTPPEPVAAAPAPAPAPPAAPAIEHPIEESAEATASAPAPLTLDNADPALRNALTSLVGSNAVALMLRTDDFARRFVVTVDNLGRSHAAPRLWPVAPAAGKFNVQGSGGAEQQVAAANAARYDAFVAFATSVDPKRAAAQYRRFYPLFQRAYQELGYPQAYFNDRMVAVIDLMLATPEPASPPTVRLTEVKGPITPGTTDRPWTRYEFTDPALESQPAGSKILLRMGPEHTKRLKAQLRAFRAEIARRP
jgi:hypothetical protein